MARLAWAAPLILLVVQPAAASDSRELFRAAVELGVVEDPAELPFYLPPAAPADKPPNSPGYSEPSVDELRRALLGERVMRAQLGEPRMREIESARFQLHLMEVSPLRDFQNDPFTHEAIEGTLGSNLGKLARRWLENATSLHSAMAKRDEKRERLHQERARERGRHLSISPRASAGDHGYVGVKLRLRGEPSDLLSNFAVSSRHYYETGDSALKLSYRRARTEAALEYRFGGEANEEILSEDPSGDRVSFWMITSW